mmetsp:Transcript_22862/g.35183  ORF Transcript_22862/g.35183 Transcript_22862/m.35183 type:complete len:127 (-) Transcript_22862:34-414(-)
MQLYNDNPHMVKDKADELLQNMLDLKENMVENIDKLIQRDGKIEIIAEKALQLSTVSNSYKTKSRKLKEQERRKRYCQLAVCAAIIVLIVLLILWKLFGGSSDDDEKSDAEGFLKSRLAFMRPSTS